MTGPPQPSRGVAITNWMVSKASGLLERKTSRRGFLVGSAMAGSAVAVAGSAAALTPGAPYAHITDCTSGLCTDGYTEFCCTINNGLNACPSGSFAGGWWRADYSSFCNGTRYYIDCMQSCCGQNLGNGFCAGCVECSCGGGCDTRRIYCNYFRYGQCHQEIGITGPIACRVVTCTPPYADASLACTTADAVDNSTAEHTSAHPCVPPPPPFVSKTVLPAAGATSVSTAGVVSVFARRSDGGVFYREFNGTWGAAGGLGPSINSGVAAAADSTGLYVFGRGTDNGIWYQRRVGASWSGWQALGPTAISDPSAVAHSSGIYVFMRGTDDGVWYQQFAGSSWSGWRSLGPTTHSNPQAVVDPSGLYVFVVGADNGIWYRRYSGSWDSWQSLGPSGTSDPAVVSDPTGLYVFVRGVDNAVWYRRAAFGAWSGWQSLGPTATSDPVAVSDPSGLYVFVRGTNNGIWYQRLTGGTWSGWQSLGPTSVSTPTVASSTNGLFVFVVGSDQALWYQRFAGGAWSGWQSLGGALAPQHATR